MATHSELPDSGNLPHWQIDDDLNKLKATIEHAPVSVTGARNNPEAALANLLTALATLGLITDNTSAT
jgi:hypothetical protein